MTTMTVLEIVQDIASDMTSDEVNSITDTLESMQIARIVQSSYLEMMSNKNWKHLEQLSTLDSSGDTAKPTHMRMPSNTKELKDVQYDKIKTGETRSRIKPVTYVTPDAFLRQTNLLNNDNADVTVVTDVSGVKLLIKNDTPPTYYTSFDDNYVVFDSYDSAVDTTLQSSKTQCIAVHSPTFTLSDTHTPNLPEEAFPGFLAEAKSTCFARIKQAPDQKSEQQAKRQRTWLSRKGWKAGTGMQFPDYGR